MTITKSQIIWKIMIFHETVRKLRSQGNQLIQNLRKHRYLQGETKQEQLGLTWGWCYQTPHKLVGKILLKTFTNCLRPNRGQHENIECLQVADTRRNSAIFRLFSADLKGCSPRTVKVGWEYQESHPRIWERGRASTVRRSRRPACVLLSYFFPKRHKS